MSQVWRQRLDMPLFGPLSREATPTVRRTSTLSLKPRRFSAQTAVNFRPRLWQLHQGLGEADCTVAVRARTAIRRVNAPLGDCRGVFPTLEVRFARSRKPMRSSCLHEGRSADSSGV